MLGAYILMEITLVAFAFLWVFIYSMLIYSDGDQAYYEAYAQKSSPVVAVVLAGPVFFLTARLMRNRWPDQALRLALTSCVLALVVALPQLLLYEAESLSFQLTTAVLSMATMLTGALLGARRSTG